MKRQDIFSCFLMHFGFVVYSFYTVVGKIASTKEFLSLSYILLYAAVLCILFVYAILWQQVLVHVKLSVATANKAITIIWGMLWGFLFFNEEITLRKIIGVLVIAIGILVLSFSDEKQREKEYGGQ